ncbi:hypothetical protein BDW42DRAFT_197632 [Aspergillus taichungensis]|uniref:SigF-like NTF2-like domain-containing protein n=1 Tax=Aspergillus taichungensis TaxID=482145 RepID=A0A2J5HFL3_9EURO|nr:hypothetical protein BDW42DRAFT_197632 [Aspergillus taichungensis]
MENPVRDITNVIRQLTQGPPEIQSWAIDRYFTSDATFVHPFCRVWGKAGGRDGIKIIFQWYKIMSPEISLDVNSIAYDKEHLRLYVNISQVFSIWLVPFYRAPVTLTTVLDLTRDPGDGRPLPDANAQRYYIAKQEDLYQTSEFIKFVVPWGGSSLVMLWQTLATLFCLVGAYGYCAIARVLTLVFFPFSREGEPFGNMIKVGN